MEKAICHALGFGVLFISTAPAIAINITMDYEETDRPSFDADGSRLRAIVNAAAAIWEPLLVSREHYEINFAWDFDLDGNTLAETFPQTLTANAFIDFNPSIAWFFDPTPLDHREYAFNQTLIQDLTSGQQDAWFDGDPPSLMEVGYSGSVVPTAPSAAQTNFDLLSTAVHEIGHALGINTGSGDYEVYPHQVAGRNVTILSDTGGHIAPQTALMRNAGGATGLRRLPSAVDIMAVSEDEGIRNIDLPRKDLFTNSGVWQTPTSWLGGRVPDAGDDVFVRYPGAEVLVSPVADDAHAKNLSVSENTSVEVFGPGRLFVEDRFDLDSAELILNTGPAGAAVSVADTFAMNRTALLTLEGGLFSTAALSTHVQSQIIGHGQLVVSGNLNHDGVIRAVDGDIVVFARLATPFDLDGSSESGRLVAEMGNITINGQPSDPLDGTVYVGANRTIAFNDGWMLGGSGNLQFVGGVATVRGESSLGGLTEVLAGQAVIDGPLTLGGQVHLSSNTSLDLIGRTRLNGEIHGRFNNASVRQLGDLSVGNFLTALVNVDNYDWDGDNFNITTVGGFARFTINAESIDSAPGDGYDGTILLDGGTLKVTTSEFQPNPTPPPLLVIVYTPWRMEGLLVLNEFETPAVIDRSGSRMIVGDNDDRRAQVNVRGHGIINAPVTFEATARVDVASDARLELGGHAIVVNGALFSGGGEVYVAPTGTLSAAGELGTVRLINDGTISPGSSPGILSVQHFTQSAGGTLVMEIASTSACDQLVALFAELDGTLDVVLLDGYVPKEGFAIQLFDFGLPTGAFANVHLPQLSNAMRWDTSLLYEDGVIVAVPEPAALGTLILGAAFVLRRRVTT